MTKDNARAQLAAWDSNRSAGSPDRRSPSIDLLPQRGTVPRPLEAMALFAPLIVAFGLILMIGCVNVANLLLARGVARQREIGIRLSLGASRRRIVRQLMTESMLLALAAAAGGYLISRLALEGAVSWAVRMMPVDIGHVNLSVPAADWRVAVFLVVVAMAATGFFALIPALQATRIDPVRTLRGQLVKDARPGRARNALIGVQVFASALLLTCAAIFLRSAIASARYEPGLRTADTVLLDINSGPKRAAMIEALTSDPTITAYAAVRPQLLAPLRLGFADSGEGKIPVTFKSVSWSYFDVLGVPIVRGRAFMPWERDQYPVAIISESVARALWPHGNGVGETFRLEPGSGFQSPRGFLRINPDAPGDDGLVPARKVTVVGVARDVPGFRVTGIQEAGVFLPTGLDVAKTSLVARVQGDPDLARQALLDRLANVEPNGGTRHHADGGEAGDAVPPDRLLGLIAGMGLAAALATTLLATPAGALVSQIVHVADPVAYLASFGMILAACLVAAWIPAARAAKVDPMQALRQQ